MPFDCRQRYTSCDSHHMIPIGCWWAWDLFGSGSLTLQAAAPTRHLTHLALVLLHPWALICVQLAYAHLDARVASHVSPSGVQLLLQGDVRLFVLCAFWLGRGCREVRFLRLASIVLRLCRLQHHGWLWTTDRRLSAGWAFWRILGVRWRRGGRVAYYFLIVRELAVCPEALNGKKRVPGQIPEALAAVRIRFLHKDQAREKQNRDTTNITWKIQKILFVHLTVGLKPFWMTTSASNSLISELYMCYPSHCVTSPQAPEHSDTWIMSNLLKLCGVFLFVFFRYVYFTGRIQDETQQVCGM